jgi:RNA recognition motif-containing protein
LSIDTNEAELDQHFSIAGKVTSVAIVRGRYSKQSRGLALIEMETEDGLRRAIDRFNGFSFRGNIIEVNHHKNYAAWTH